MPDNLLIIMDVMMSKFTITESFKGKPILQLNGLRHASANKNGTTGWGLSGLRCRVMICHNDVAQVIC